MRALLTELVSNRFQNGSPGTNVKLKDKEGTQFLKRT